MGVTILSTDGRTCGHNGEPDACPREAWGASGCIFPLCNPTPPRTGEAVEITDDAAPFESYERGNHVIRRERPE